MIKSALSAQTEQLKAYQDKHGFPILHFPTVLGAVVPTYNVPGVSGALNFTPEALAGIYLGKITKWNDPAIAGANKGVAGETAPLLFTALGNPYWNKSWTQPTASLPAMIYYYALSAYDDYHRQAWAGGLVLLALILIINIVARTILARGIAVPRS